MGSEERQTGLTMRLTAPLCRKLKKHYAQAMKLDVKTNNFWQATRLRRVMNVQGLNSIEFQLDVKQDFQQSTLHSVRLNALLKILLNSLLKFT